MSKSSKSEDKLTDTSACSSTKTTTSDSTTFVKNACKKELSHYYKKQNEILEHYKQDSDQIEAARRSRERIRELRQSESEVSEDGEKVNAAETANDSIQSKDSLLVRHEASQNEEKQLEKSAAHLAYITLFVNFLLMIAKITAAYFSGSMSIISSMVDSIVDLTSGAVLSISAVMIRKRDPYQYPRGRTRVEPLALILISVIMGMASVQLIISSVSRIRADDQKNDLDVGWRTSGIMLSTIAVKLTLFIICQKYKANSSIKVLALDHRNDCISNSVALACAWIAYYYNGKTISLFGLCPVGGCDPYYLDPIGAIIVSFYILYTWIRTGYVHFVMLSGKSAHPELINRIIHQCIEHDRRITHIDTVYVYHYGTKFLVEIHIVLDKNMSLKDSHDIAESLQTGIEALLEIERAFVHCDYEFEHHPQDEHKAV